MDWLVNWWNGLLWTPAWGSIAEWFGGIFTGAAAFIAAIAYASGRRQDKWSQARQIIFELGSGDLTVHNASDKPIVDVQAELQYRSMWSAVRVGNFHDSVMFGLNSFVHGSDHDYYMTATRAHRRLKRANHHLPRHTFSRQIKAGESATLTGEWLHVNGAKTCVTFVDAHGRAWSFDVEERRLRSGKRRRSPLKMRRRTFRAMVWMIRNESINLWRNCLYYPKGRPTSKKS